jgi:hypothetical protein
MNLSRSAAQHQISSDAQLALKLCVTAETNGYVRGV